MMNYLNLSKAKDNLLTYGGLAGKKRGITIDNENYIIKYTKSLISRANTELPYANTPISEYIGSHIYSLLGIDVHETFLPVEDVDYENKLVICKDFTELPTLQLTEFREFMATYDNDIYNDVNPANDRSTDFEIIYDAIKNHKILNMVPGVEKRFWEMFIVDAIIGNTDRNNDNWGVLVDATNGKLPIQLAPVYDNGACFYPAWYLDKIKTFMNNDTMFENIAYRGVICAYTRNNKKINPFHLMQNMKYKECSSILIDIYNRFPINEIFAMLDELVSKKRINDINCKFIKQLIDVRMHDVLKLIVQN